MGREAAWAECGLGRDDDDYNVEFYTVESIDEGQEASTPQQLEVGSPSLQSTRH
jgi:hypothetical protein